MKIYFIYIVLNTTVVFKEVELLYMKTDGSLETFTEVYTYLFSTISICLSIGNLVMVVIFFFPETEHKDRDFKPLILLSSCESYLINSLLTFLCL